MNNLAKVDPFPSSKTEILRVVSAKTLVQNPPATPPVLIESILYTGSTLILSAPSKGRKTWIMLHLAICIATGKKFLGYSTAKTPVLFLNFELQEFAIYDRVKAICSALGVDVPDNLYLANQKSTVVALDTLRKELPDQIAKLGAGVVIADPYYKISAVSGGEENSNDSQAKLLSELEAICTKNGAALCFSHHFAKGDSAGKNHIDRASGGGVFARFPDAIATLNELEEEECVSLVLSLRNFAPIADIGLRWEYPLWVRDDSVDPSKLKQKGGRRKEHTADELLAKLVNGMTNGEWRTAVGWSDSTYRRVRDELMQARKIREGSGCFYRNAP